MPEQNIRKQSQLTQGPPAPSSSWETLCRRERIQGCDGQGATLLPKASETGGNEGTKWGAPASVKDGPCPGRAFLPTDSLATTPPPHSFCTASTHWARPRRSWGHTVPHGQQAHTSQALHTPGCPLPTTSPPPLHQPLSPAPCGLRDLADPALPLH